MSEASTLLAEIARVIARHTPGEGELATAVPNLYLSRKTAPSDPTFTVQWPCFALVAQGAKSLALGADLFHYGVGDYLVVSADLPVRSSVTSASARRPNLGIGLALDPHRIGALLDRVDARQIAAAGADALGVSVNRATPALLEATRRLVRLLDHPRDIPALAPLIEEEIAYHLLRGPCGARVLHLVASTSGESRTHIAARWIRQNFTKPLRIERLARTCGMSVSSLHHHFKALAGLTPLQYQKEIRLQEARRLLRATGIDVTSASARVGYASASQFSREYARLFGVSPRQDRSYDYTSRMSAESFNSKGQRGNRSAQDANAHTGARV